MTTCNPSTSLFILQTNYWK